MGLERHDGDDPAAFIRRIAADVDAHPRRRDIPGRPPPTPVEPVSCEGVSDPITQHEIEQLQNALEDARPAPLAPSSPTTTLAPPYIARGQDVLAALSDSFPNGAADERLLLELAAEQVAVVAAVHSAEAQLAARLSSFGGTPAQLYALARALREVVALGGAVGRQIQGGLIAAASLRSTRKLLGQEGRNR